MAIIYITEPAQVQIDGDGVCVTYRSGGDIYARRVSRALFRQFLEENIRRLNDFEVEQRGAAVVPIRAGRATAGRSGAH